MGNQPVDQLVKTRAANLSVHLDMLAVSKQTAESQKKAPSPFPGGQNDKTYCFTSL